MLFSREIFKKVKPANGSPSNMCSQISVKNISGVIK